MRERLHPHVLNMNMIIKLKEKCMLASKEEKLKLLICYLVEREIVKNFKWHYFVRLVTRKLMKLQDILSDLSLCTYKSPHKIMCSNAF